MAEEHYWSITQTVDTVDTHVAADEVTVYWSWIFWTAVRVYKITKRQNAYSV